MLSGGEDFCFSFLVSAVYFPMAIGCEFRMSGFKDGGGVWFFFFQLPKNQNYKTKSWQSFFLDNHFYPCK